MARLFNGTTQYLGTLPGTSSTVFNVPANSAVSISAWINVTAFPSGESAIAAKGYNGSVVPYSMEFVDATHFAGLRSYNGSNHAAQWAYTSAWQVGTWNHVYGDYDGAAWHTYFNGTLVATSVDGTGPQSATNSWGIGAIENNSVGPTQYFNGAIEGVCLRKCALNQVEIWALSRREIAELNIRRGNIIGYWPINGSDQEVDLSGNNLLMPLNGAPPVCVGPSLHLPPPKIWQRSVSAGVVGNPYYYRHLAGMAA